jgi:putative endonuclease
MPRQGILPMHRRFWVYIMASITGTLYIGITNDLEVRVRQHKAGEIEGFSSKYHCTRLVHHESFDSVLKATRREKQLKGWRRSKKIALIKKANPRCADLAEKWGAEMRFAGQFLS